VAALDRLADALAAILTVDGLGLGTYGGLAIGLLLARYGLLSVICGLALPETKHRSLSVPDSVTAAA
jgi:hypothetical protein